MLARIYVPLRRFAGAVAPPDADPDDLVQEAVARVLRRTRLDALDDAEVYLRRVILRLASNHRRAWSRRAPTVGFGDPAAVGLDDEYPSDLADLAALPPETRAVLWLRVVERQTFAEISRLLDTGESAVRQRASRGLRRLRADLRAELAEPIEGGTP